MPDKTAQRLQLQEYLPYRLSVTANAASRLIARAYEVQFGLTIPQWRLMAVLGDEGALTQQALCGRTLMDKVTVMRAAQGLTRRRLVRRQPNAQDGRSHRLKLSASGQALYGRIIPLARAFEAQLLAGMKASDVSLLQRLLRQVEATALTLTEKVQPP
ncbi:MAG TPA: MarR family winged helix-turn-helix transcriptional regulator [Steroidobacteraceae bacterium]|nr:MarR family winged helix-turn-helix transcriptional regulator [Steroidobacteraceae bacterium]